MIDAITVRPIEEKDFAELDAWFGLTTVYKKPHQLWVDYYNQTKNDQRMAVVAECAQKIVGYCTLKFSSNYAPFKLATIPEISDLGVILPNRNHGIGRTIMTYLETFAKERGATEIGIGFGLYGDYGPAQRLYVKMGYIPDGRGATYAFRPVEPGQTYPVNDDLVLWFTKQL
jgi:GNAT superfamily N-acetyltransferase